MEEGRNIENNIGEKERGGFKFKRMSLVRVASGLEFRTHIRAGCCSCVVVLYIVVSTWLTFSGAQVGEYYYSHGPCILAFTSGDGKANWEYSWWKKGGQIQDPNWISNLDDVAGEGKIRTGWDIGPIFEGDIACVWWDSKYILPSNLTFSGWRKKTDIIMVISLAFIYKWRWKGNLKIW